MISLSNLVSLGICNVAYPSLLRAAMEKAAVSWRRFCLLPPELKKRFMYANTQGVDGDGYECKDAAGDKKDLKENFHATFRAYGNLAMVANQLRIDSATAFIHDAQDIANLVKPMVLEFAQSLEEQYGLPGLAQEVQDGQQGWFLRYLHYFGDRTPGEEIAAAHTDKSGFTLHLYESAPGLQYLEYDSRQWLPMPVSEGETVIIPNVQLQYKSRGRLKALCHRVVATDTSFRSGRYSVVCFIPLIKTPAYNKNAKGRMQEFAPGFNYDMPINEFSQLFI